MAIELIFGQYNYYREQIISWVIYRFNLVQEKLKNLSHSCTKEKIKYHGDE